MHNWYAGSRSDDASTFQEFVLTDGTNNLLFTASTQPIQADLFLYDNVTQANFQMLLWSDNRGDTTATSYDMYVQLA